MLPGWKLPSFLRVNDIILTMRTLMRIIAYTCVVVFCFMIAMLVQNSDDLNVTNYVLESSKISPAADGFKILQLSDLHNHSFSYRNANLIEKIDKADPDAVVCTGDFIDSHTKNLQELDTLFAHFQEKGQPVYFVSGNHEAHADEAFTQSFYSLMASRGVEMIEGKRITLAPGLTLSGIRDPAWVASDHGFLSLNEGDVEEQLTKLDEGFDSSSMNVLISHRPELFKLYQNHGYELAFAGHTHGNQMDFGFTPFSVNSFAPRYVAGLYREGTDSLIVSRGLGYSYSLPWRFNCDAEIVITTLKSK